MSARRIVTGHDAHGKAIFVEDGPAPNHLTLNARPGWEMNTMWVTRGTPRLPNEGDPSMDGTSYLPVPGGTRFIVATLPSRSQAAQAADAATYRAEYNAKVPGLGHVHEEGPDPSMHTTETVDYVVILSGEVWLELDDGKAVLVKAGDTVIQNGTRHAWRNRAEQPCVLAAVMIGAERQPDG